ncbi:hypothetical protein CBR_g27966 [Chara braunii]|uniref:Uncharacterized protein n=1 Tax=Chara braunii TaxID=69332 RepID=A0A388L927_CHABU|nr:hypothetical protein CBR_g27966 [Chara braunii]|eukprot:GBG78742.1 hypothetical protein CBR_g27966 [Chara braunii]
MARRVAVFSSWETDCVMLLPQGGTDGTAISRTEFVVRVSSFNVWESMDGWIGVLDSKLARGEERRREEGRQMIMTRILVSASEVLHDERPGAKRKEIPVRTASTVVALILFCRGHWKREGLRLDHFSLFPPCLFPFWKQGLEFTRCDAVEYRWWCSQGIPLGILLPSGGLGLHPRGGG